jgi:hypothetical protein
METLIYAFIFALAFIWPIAKLPRGVKRILNGYAFFFDIVVGATMSWLFLGTMSGMLVAVVATVVFTAYLSYSYHTIGGIRLSWRGWREV